MAFFKSFMTGPTILRVKRGDRIILEEPELVRILEMNQRVSSTPLSPPKGIFTPPKGTFTLLEFAMALTEVNSSESEQKEEAKRLKKDLQRHWQDDSSRKPRVRATGSRDVEYFDFDDLVQIAKERGVYFDAESVKKRLSG
ncbi:MAG: hypothetical protein KDA89_22240 [Planctomycetaceae bacterium]|nr:hypothetical protein [Planctomycetaceae bacterium]